MLLIVKVPPNFSHFSLSEETKKERPWSLYMICISFLLTCLFSLNVCATAVEILHLVCFWQTSHHCPLVPSWSFFQLCLNAHRYFTFPSPAHELHVLSRKTNNFNSASKPQFVSDLFQPIQHHHNSLEHCFSDHRNDLHYSFLLGHILYIQPL